MLIFRKFIRRAWSALTWGSLRTKLLVLAAAIFGIAALGAVVGTTFFAMSPGEAFWWAWTHMLDPGFLGEDRDMLAKQVWGSLITAAGLIVIGGAFISLAEEATNRTMRLMLKGRVPSGLHGHTVIAGQGRRLPAFIAAVARLGSEGAQGKTVVVVPDSEALAESREICGEETILTTGQIFEQSTQKRLSLDRARRVILLDNFGGNSGAMLEAILLLDEKRRDLSTATPLTLYAEVNDRALAGGMRQVLAEVAGNNALTTFHVLNAAEASARLTLREAPLDVLPVRSGEGHVVLIIDQWSIFAQALFWHAVRIAHYAATPTRIVVVHPEPERIRAEVQDQAPGLGTAWCAESLVDVRFVRMLASATGNLSEQDQVTVAVCSQPSDVAFPRALQIRDSRIPGLKQVYVELADGSGYARAVEKLQGRSDVRLVATGAAHRAFELAESLDAGASALHARYLKQREDQDKREQRPDGRYVSKSDYDWAQLDEVRRSWNRAAADHMEVKLRTLADFHGLPRPGYDSAGGMQIPEALRAKICEIVAAISDQQDSPRADFELLARLEHGRWSAEKVAEGWAYGAEKDEEKKLTPFLLDYDHLTEDVKNYDREPVAQLLTDLA